MKVLSLTEPYATLIKEGYKKIETRSFKTNYRGKLYIHASKTSIPKRYKERKAINFVKDKNFNFGNIILECDLVDCILMTEEFIEKIKRENYTEYLCGEYEVGRYAWILDNIKVLDTPIKTKGMLGIWNYEEFD